MRNYSVFVFVKSVWNRRDERDALSLTEWFVRRIKNLPKFELVEREPHAEGEGGKKQKIQNQFRVYLAENWYYLKRAIEESDKLKLGVRDAPYAITKTFLARSVQPQAPVEPILAEKQKLID